MSGMLQSALSMDAKEQNDWLQLHIPHRVRAALARLELLSEYLGAPTPGDPDLTQLTRDANIRRRCEMNSVNEGRFAAIRWLIEFIGIKPNKKDVRITDFGGKDFDAKSPGGQKLLDIWDGISNAGSHATDAYGHSDVSDTSLCAAMRLIVAHLQATIYEARNLTLIEIALVWDEVKP
jgi:hypothetical protein